MTTDERKTGSIARLVRDRVFGFLYCKADQRDYFFHQAHLENCSFSQLQEGDILSFTVGTARTGKPEAQEIRLEPLERHELPQGHETREQVGLPPIKSKRTARRG